MFCHLIFFEKVNIMSLGERIYELRSGKGMSQGELADKLDAKRASDAQAVLQKDATIAEKL